jgi:hypothetical protein
MKAVYATDYVENPSEARRLKDVVREGYAQDIVIFFPRCFVPETCPGLRYRGYFLCNDRPGDRCRLTYRQAKDVVCKLGEYTLLSRKRLKENGLSGKILVIPGGRQIVDVCLAEGLPRAALGVACPPDLKEGRQKLERIGVKTFLVPLTKLEYDLKNIRKVTVQSCYENVVKYGTGRYLKILDRAVHYVLETKKRELTVEDYLKKTAT